MEKTKQEQNGSIEDEGDLTICLFSEEKKIRLYFGKY